ncbi:MAG: ATP-binding protein [Candidatus Marinimicrobia bacterium]|nr:ATP-binding protein [Candidatus Neomarinimicrobiota bacterium]
MIKVSRTIADIAGDGQIAVNHLADSDASGQYRNLDRQLWLG